MQNRITYYNKTFGRKGGRCIYCGAKAKGAVSSGIHEAKVRCCKKHQDQGCSFLCAMLLGEDIHKAEKFMFNRFQNLIKSK